MLFVNRDINGSPLPDGFAAALWNEAAKPIVRLYFDFSGTGVDVEIPPEDVISFSISDKVEGTNGRACANTVSLELHNYYHRYSSHVGNETYDPTIYAYNGPLQADGRGNLRPKRRFRIHVSLPEFPGVTVRIFEGIVGTRGFSESIGAGNENTVKVEINDYAKLLLDKKPTGAKVQYGSQWTEKEFCLRNLTISNPNLPTQSLIHRIVAVLDPDFAKIKVTAQEIPIIIPYAPLEDNLWSEIATLAEAVHGIAVFTGETLYFGDSRFFGVEESDIVIDNSRFSNLSHYDNTADIKNKLSLSYSQYKKLPMCALWMYPGSDKFGNIPNGGKLFDLTNPDDLPELFDPNVVFKAKYAVNVNTPTVMAGFLAGTPGITVTQEVADNYEVMAADNLGYKMNLSPNITALTRFDITTLRSSAIIHMDKGPMTTPILKNLVIYGEPVVKTDENRSFAENASSISQYGELSEEYDNKYITRDVIATSSGSKTHDKAWLDIAMARSSVPRRTYEFSCSMPLLLAKSGTIVTIRESLQGSGVNVKARLDQVSVKYNGVTARWTTSFLAKEEVLLTPVYDYQGQVTPNNGGYAPEPRHIDASEGGILVPYSVGDTLTYTDGMLYRAVAPKAINEEFSIADFVLVTPSNQDQVNLLSKMLSVPISSITRSRAGELTPPSIPISAFNSDGTPYSGRFKVSISHDNGQTWADSYESDADESMFGYSVNGIMVVGGDNFYVNNIHIELYEAGGTENLLREVFVPISLDASASPAYWETRDVPSQWPSSGMLPGDFLLDGRAPVASGPAEGGVMRRWDGEAWVQFLSTDVGYGDAFSRSKLDLMVWAKKYGVTTIAAVNGIFESIAASKAFIAELEAQEIALKGTLRTGDGASENARVAIMDSVGVVSNVFVGDGTNDLSVVEDSTEAGIVKIEITEAQVGDTGPSGGKIVSLAPNIEASPSDLAYSGWDASVAAAAAASIGGKDDWILPTRAQLQAIRTQFGSTLLQVPYWTREASGDGAYTVDMATGVEDLSSKTRDETSTKTLPTSMGRYTSQLYNGKIYMPEYNGTKLEIYDIATGATTTKNLPTSMRRATSQLYNGKIYMPQYGGTTLEIYDIAAGTTTTKTLPTSMARYTSQLYNGKIYMPEYNGTKLEIYDIATGTTTTKTLPTTMLRNTSQLYNGKIYMPQHGGTTLEIYDIAADTTTTKTLPTSMGRYTSQLYNGKIYMPQNDGTTLEIYDIATGTTTTKNLPTSMGRNTSQLYNGKIYMPQHNGTTLEIYDIATGTTTTKTLPASMYRATSQLYNGKIYMPQYNGMTLEIYMLPLPARPIRTNTETKRWKHQLNSGAFVNHGVIVAGSIEDVAIGIKVSWAGDIGHIVGDSWTLEQDSMMGMSIRDSVGDEYMTASGGKVYIKDLEIGSALTTLLSYQKDSATRSFSTAWADGWISNPFTVPRRTVVKVDFAIPFRNDSTGWGGGYTQIKYEINNSGVWEDLGHSGYDANVMHNGAPGIATYTNHFILDFSGSEIEQSVRIAFRHRSYDGTLIVNGSHEIADGEGPSFAWSHFMAYSLTGLVGQQGPKGENGSIIAESITGNFEVSGNLSVAGELVTAASPGVFQGSIGVATGANPSMPIILSNQIGGFYVAAGKVVIPHDGWYKIDAFQLIQPSGNIYYRLMVDGVTKHHSYGSAMMDYNVSWSGYLLAGSEVSITVGGTVTNAWAGEHSSINIVSLAPTQGAPGYQNPNQSIIISAAAPVGCNDGDIWIQI